MTRHEEVISKVAMTQTELTRLRARVESVALNNKTDIALPGQDDEESAALADF